ncbi:histone PARylation factor 1 isoform X2 [Brienomyrus brachyistius]|uniref:histone PARylation factor 1 isoform X2 n=1 Tax=Brienomyrus brachyistius TaxID=42636 RepID=UPI0020B18F12|nr:histone PARylation factor 1 isoform X2 [Brienomyrus brachyistius]
METEEGGKMAGRGKRKPKSAVQEPEPTNRDMKRPRSDLETRDLAQEVERLYKLRMPPDFYHFWALCQRLSPECPQDALKQVLGLHLVGPYDILAGRHKSALNSTPNYYLHWRYFYDPPELQTILVGDRDSQHHMGYYRIFLERRKKELPSKKQSSLLLSLEAEIRDTAKTLGYSLEQKSKSMKQRARKVVAQTFHGAGIVVPVDKNDVGYRELPETDAGLRKICKAIADAKDDEERMKAFAPIQEMITYVQFANDECDYGMGYELGIDLFCYGSHYFYKVIRQLLPMAYTLLKRGLFGDILEAHLSSRSLDNLDQLSA